MIIKPKILSEIPYFNHPETRREVVEKSLAEHKDVMVVDDGSEITAAEILRDTCVPIETHTRNKGKGEALLTAGRYAKENGFSHVVTLDADGQHDPRDFGKFKAAIKAEPSNVFVGCRDLNVDNVPTSSKFGRQFSNFWFRLQTGKSLKDCQSGFRAYPSALLTEIKYMSKRFAFEVEVLVRAAWAGLACSDIDITVYYPPPDTRVSHFNKLRDNLSLTILNTHLTGRSVTPWPHQKLTITPEKTLGTDKITLIHPFRSFKRLLAEHTTPGDLARAAALGIFIATLPIFFFHTVAIIYASTYFRTNKPFAVSMSQLCMPPFVPALCIGLGYFMRNGHFLTTVSYETLWLEALDRLLEWLLGSLILAPLFALISAGTIYLVASLMKKDVLDNKSDRPTR